MLSEKQAAFLRQELEAAKNPFFFYDSDADGLSAFLLLYRMHREGKGISINTSTLTSQSLRKVVELHPDKIFILDIPKVDQEFLDGVKRPVFWLDHHQPQERQFVHYYNPRVHDPDAYVPTTRMTWQVSQRSEDLWIAMVGCLADWYWPDFAVEFQQRYPMLLSEDVDLAKAVYHSPIGTLVKMFFFLQKGQAGEVHQSVKVLTRIHSPEEILQQQTAQGKFLFQRFQKINQKYEVLLQQARKCATRSDILIFNYAEHQWSFTANLANELTVLYPKKVIIIARKKGGEMKCSLRAQHRIVDTVERSLVGLNGFGGGHANACGVVVKEEDWEVFLKRFKEEIRQK